LRCARDAGRQLRRIFFDSLARIIKWDDGTPGARERPRLPEEKCRSQAAWEEFLVAR
jgi:hypothetical protein